MRKTVFGLALIILGILSFMQVSGMASFGLSFWPVVALLAGISILTKSLFRRFRGVSWFGVAFGSWLTAVGLTNILQNAGMLSLGGVSIMQMGWPILLVGIGLGIIFGKRRQPWEQQGFAMHHGHGMHWRRGGMGDLRYGPGPWRLDGDLNVGHGMGDLKMDLTVAEITEGVHNIRIEMGAGEVFIRVPDNVNVKAQASSNMGEVQLFGDNRGGIQPAAERDIKVPDSKIQINLLVRLGMGSVRMVLGSAGAGPVVTLNP